MNGISNDQDVMDYSLNKATEEVLENSLQLETRNFIHNFLIAVLIGVIWLKNGGIISLL